MPIRVIVTPSQDVDTVADQVTAPVWSQFGDQALASGASLAAQIDPATMCGVTVNQFQR